MAASKTWLGCLCCWLAFSIGSRAPAAEQPNVLIILADDCTHADLPIYGGQNAQTPNLDGLARQSLVFNRAYLCTAMCQPCRAELYSGQYPMRNGCAWNHSASRNDTRSLPQLLGPLGYRVGLAGKFHVAPQSAFPFERVPGFDKSCVRNPTQAHRVDGIQEFMARNDQPFCLVVALVEPHVPWVMGDPSQYPPESIKLPPNIADTELTRDAFSRYLAEVSYMDAQVGEILQQLESTGKSDETLVLFSSEQGSQFPGCKWTNWDTGVHTALIARWPGKISAGTRTNALVQYADVVPTLVQLAEGDPESMPLDGTSFVPVLLGTEPNHRQYVYGMHNNVPEGPAYPIRSVTDGRFHYVWNLTPNEIYIEKHLMGLNGTGNLNNPYWATWIWDSTISRKSYSLVKRYMHREEEQLYRLTDDPYEMNNLARQDEWADVKARLRNTLVHWMHEQGDPGVELDTIESHRAAKRGAHRFLPPD